MSAHPIDDLVTQLALARERLLSAIAPLDQAASDQRPGAARWSPGEVLDHLALSESGVVKVIGRLVHEAGDGGSDADLPDQRDRLAFAALHDRQRRVVSPSSILPRAHRSKDDLLHDLARSRILLLDLARRMHGRDLRGAVLPHPLLGSLDAYQWMLFVAQHEARHTAQILEAR